MSDSEPARAKTQHPRGRERGAMQRPPSTGRRLAEFYAQCRCSPMDRVLVRYRPCICPLDRVVELAPTGARTLDMGSGRGTLIMLLALEGKLASGVGVDTSSAAIELARQAADALERETGVKIDFQCAGVERVAGAIEQGSFDLVTMIDVMHHLPAHARHAVVGSCAAALAPGGVFIYKDMCVSPWWRRLANRAHDLLLAKQWIHETPIEQVEDWALQAGLALERAERIDMLWYGHELRVFRKARAAEGGGRHA